MWSRKHSYPGNHHPSPSSLWTSPCAQLLMQMPAMINLACTDIHTNEVQLFVATLVLLLLPVALILVSYGFIVQAVSKIKSFQAWRRALETCGSHLWWCSSSLGPAQPYTFNQRDSTAIARGSSLHSSTLL